MNIQAIPKPLLDLMTKMLQSAAPQLIPTLETVADAVIQSKAQLDRIEQQNRAIMAHFGIMEGTHDGNRQFIIEKSGVIEQPAQLINGRSNG